MAVRPWNTIEHRYLDTCTESMRAKAVEVIQLATKLNYIALAAAELRQNTGINGLVEQTRVWTFGLMPDTFVLTNPCFMEIQEFGIDALLSYLRELHAHNLNSARMAEMEPLPFTRERKPRLMGI